MTSLTGGEGALNDLISVISFLVKLSKARSAFYKAGMALSNSI